VFITLQNTYDRGAVAALKNPLQNGAPFESLVYAIRAGI
jgi:hypothetical protein